MSDNTAIEWADATWNPVRARLRSDPSRKGWHCEHFSPGCASCYAEGINEKRFGTGLPYKPGHREDVEIYLDEKMLAQPLRWGSRALASSSGAIGGKKIFVCSMTDLFGEFVTDEQLDRVFAVMALCPRHTFQVLTKRGGRMREYFNAVGVRDEIWSQSIAIPALTNFPTQWPLPNVWLGVSVEDQQRADERREDLRNTPAALKFVSYEPALGPVDWTGWEFLDWLISGGESGPKARPSHPDWHRAARDFSAANGLAYFFKQWGEWQPGFDVCPPGARGWRIIDNEGFVPVGKKRAGRLLDGVEYSEFPR